MSTLSNAARVRLLYGHAGILEDDVPSAIAHAMARLDGRQLEAVELVVAAAIQNTARVFLESTAEPMSGLEDLRAKVAAVEALRDQWEADDENDNFTMGEAATALDAALKVDAELDDDDVQQILEQWRTGNPPAFVVDLVEPHLSTDPACQMYEPPTTPEQVARIAEARGRQCRLCVPAAEAGQ
jgi:hypothetical protein